MRSAREREQIAFNSSESYQGRHGGVKLSREPAYVLGVLETTVDREAFAPVELIMEHLVAVVDQAIKITGTG